MFHLDIAKTDPVLHMLQERWLLADRGTTGLGADLDGGATAQRREEGCASGMGRDMGHGGGRGAARRGRGLHGG